MPHARGPRKEPDPKALDAAAPLRHAAPMRKLWLIGIGTGNPEHLTLQAVSALRQTQVVFALDKGGAKTELLELRRDICQRVLGDHPVRFVTAPDVSRRDEIARYGDRVDAWHEERSVIYERLIERELPPDGCGAFLVWGDPSLYDSTLRILARVSERARVSFEYEVVPGISSLQALAASHKQVLHPVGGSFVVTTGRRLAQGLPKDATDVVVMLDGACAFEHIDEDVDIYWGAYLGTADEVTCAGPLRECKPQIASLRAEARARKGWIMDTYLLRRRDTG